MDNMYFDRKMLKWLPFQSLTEQGSDLRALLESDKNVSMPTLSEDQYQVMQYRFEEAYAKHEKITIRYLYNQRLHSLEGYILSADIHQGIIVLNKGTVMIKQIIDII